MNEIYMIFVFI